VNGQLINLPTGQHTINARWLFKLKLLTSSLNNHEKARWVIKGYSQVFGINFRKTYTPVMQLENLHLLLTITVALGLCIHTMDIKSVFLHVCLVEKIYIKQPEGFVQVSAQHLGHLQPSTRHCCVMPDQSR
jgi:hypothetical protein